MPRTAYLAALIVAAPLMTSPSARAGEDTIDVTEYRPKLRLLSDGKGHYLALMPFTIGDGPDTGYLFYGDGKTFYAQRRFGGYRNGNEAFDTTFWEPRFKSNGASLAYKDKKWTVSCGDRTVDVSLVDKPEAERIFADAKFMRPRWTRQAYALARDNSGKYYYVDRAREPDNAKDFRVFRGPKGAVKPMKMLNVVNDSDGDIFITKAGKLRLVLDKHETVWLENSRSVKLTALDVGENRSLIYSDLGVYVGERLGTPCDDL